MKVGYAEGICQRCGKTFMRPRPIDYAVCDCYKYCPNDHGKGSYATEMTPYTPDPYISTYRPIKTEGPAWGDIEQPLKILYRCSICGYHSAQRPVEVKLI